MALEIPILAGVNVFEQRMLLDGEFYTLNFRWNKRASRWYLDLADGEGDMIATGLAIVVGIPITAHLRAHAGVPPGVIVCVDTTDAGEDPGFDELGERCKLIYLEAAEL